MTRLISIWWVYWKDSITKWPVQRGYLLGTIWLLVVYGLFKTETINGSEAILLSFGAVGLITGLIIITPFARKS